MLGAPYRYQMMYMTCHLKFNFIMYGLICQEGSYSILVSYLLPLALLTHTHTHIYIYITSKKQ